MEWLLVFVVFVLSLISILVLLVMESRREVKPATALVYNNMWTGKTYCMLPGTGFLIPGIHRILEREVSLQNEAQNPSNVTLITGDGIELEVDYIVRRLMVGYPKMPSLSDKEHRVLLGEAVVKAVTAIKYAERRDAILTRIVAQLQAALTQYRLDQLFPGTNLGQGQVGKVNKELMTHIEEMVNEALRGDLVTLEWGFWVEMDLEDYNLPDTIRKAREQRSSAEMAGKAIADKAAAAGVDAKWLVVADAIGDIFRGRVTKTGGEK